MKLFPRNIFQCVRPQYFPESEDDLEGEGGSRQRPRFEKMAYSPDGGSEDEDDVQPEVLVYAVPYHSLCIAQLKQPHKTFFCLCTASREKALWPKTGALGHAEEKKG